MINEIDPLWRLKITARNDRYYIKLNVKHYNTRMFYHINTARDEYEIANTNVLRNKLKEIYQTVIST